MKKLVIAIVFVLCFMCGSVALADGASSYIPEMYTVVVSNPDGAKLYDWKYEVNSSEMYPYGTILSVQKEENEGFLDIISSVWGYISTADVEIYGEPVTPQDLRFRKLWSK